MPEPSKSTPNEYLDFVLEIREKAVGTYEAEVIQSPVGRAKEVISFPFDPFAVAPTQNEAEIQKFGGDLFDAVFTGSVQDKYIISLDRAGRDRGLRIMLILTAPELVTLPWEYLYDTQRSQFLCFSWKTPVIRSTILPTTFPPQPIQGPLRILGIVASPKDPDLPPLNVAAEKSRLIRLLHAKRRAGLVELRWLKKATWHDLQEAMRHGPWHVLHFIGHGGFDKDEGFLVFCDEQGEREDLSAKLLADLIAHHPSIRLVVLNSCQGATSSQGNIFSSTASILLHKGVPSVLAMQYAISDDAAVKFSRTFYEALVDELPVDAAVVDGRMGIAIEGSLEWGTPVLFSQSLDGKIFDISPKQPEPVISAETLAPPPAAPSQPRAEMPESQTGPTREAATPPTATGEKKPPAVTAGIVLGLFLLVMVVLILVKNILDDEPPVSPISTETPTPTLTVTTEVPPSPTPTASASPTLTSTPTATPTATPSPTPTASPTATATNTPTSTPFPQVITDLQGVTMVLIPGGSIQMGAFSSTAPVLPVELNHYYMDEKEVTNSQYNRCVSAGKCPLPQNTFSKTRGNYYRADQYADYPVVYVSWEGAARFCQWRGGRLPSEAEWEYAARGGLEGKHYPWGDEPPICIAGIWNGARFKDCSEGDTGRVGQFTANDYGLYDMAGNVWEWVADWYSPTMDPSGPPESKYRVLRGGAWDVASFYLRTNVRHTLDPAKGVYSVGFRCVRTP